MKFSYIIYVMSRLQYREKVVKKCWVGEQQKVCYASREEAETAALIAERDYNAPRLTVYKCEYGNHYHLSSERLSSRGQASCRY